MERAVLATILEHPFLLEDYNVREEYFKNHQHRLVIRLMKELNSKGIEVNTFTLDHANANGSLDKTGDMMFLTQYEHLSNYDEFESYVLTLEEDWRNVEKNKVLHRSLQEDAPVPDIISKLEELDRRELSDRTTSHDVVTKYFELPFIEKDEKSKGVPTGIGMLDDVLGNLRGNKFHVIAARPAMGKTDVMLNLVRSVSKHAHAVVFSLEMTEEELSLRLISQQGGYVKQKSRDFNKNLTPEEKDRWPVVMGELGNCSYTIYDKAAQTVEDIKRKTRIEKNNNPDKDVVVMIDYLQRMGKPEGFNETEMIGKIASGLKEMAKEFDISVIALAQLSRGVESRDNKRPKLSDLRGSGEIEQEADSVTFLYREDYYNKTKKSYTPNNILEMIVEKNRDGTTGTIPVKYNAAIGKLDDMTMQEFEEAMKK